MFVGMKSIVVGAINKFLGGGVEALLVGAGN
jgi:hypothetical protein